MKVSWLVGAAHGIVRDLVSDRHVIRIRDRFGLGQEAFGARTISDVQWRAGAIDYIPPGLEHRHATRSEADWLIFEIDEAEWEDLRAFRSPAVRVPISCEAGHCLKDVSATFCIFRRAALSAHGANDLQHGEWASTTLAARLHGALFASPRCALPRGLPLNVLRALADYVDEHLTTRIRVSDLAAIARLSKFHFVSAFSSSTGVTPYRYVLLRRVTLAVRLLMDGMPPSAVAFDCGFSSQAHLGAVLKRHFGLSPSQIRRNSASALRQLNPPLPFARPVFAPSRRA